MLVDTDVMIWFLRGDPKAAHALETVDQPVLSVVTHIELVQGMRNKAELRAFRTTLREWNIPIAPIDEAISSRAVYYIEEYFLSAGLRLAGALIAATAVTMALPLFTANIKHYKAIKDLELKRFKP